jgi:fibronectin-binding autotransporter adhesin
LGVTDPTNLSIGAGVALDFSGVSGGQNGFVMNRPGEVTISGAGTISLTQFSGQPILNFGGNGTGLLTVQNVIANSSVNSVGLNKTGSHTLLLTGASTYTRGTAISGGVLQISDLPNGSTPGPLGASTNVAANLVIDGGTLRLTNTSTLNTNRSFTVGQNGATLVAGGTGSVIFSGASVALGGSGPRTLTLSGTGTAALSTPLNDSGASILSLVKSGVGAWDLGNQASNRTGTTTVSNGTLNISTFSNGGAVGPLGASSSAAGNLVLNGGGLLYYGFAANTTDRLFTLGPAGGRLVGDGSTAMTFTNPGAIAAAGSGDRTLTLGGTGAALNTLAPVVVNPSSGATAVTKADAGSWLLTGANTYTGPTTVSGGTLFVGTIGNGGTAGPLGASAATADNLVLNGGTLRYTGTGAASTNRLFTLGAAGGQITSFAVSSSLNFTNTGATVAAGTGDRTLTLAGSNTAASTFMPILVNPSAGTTSLTKVGSGVWVLAGANTYTGATTINGGTLRLSGAGTFGNLSTVTVANAAGATLDLNGLSRSIGSLTGGGATGGTVTLGAGTLTTGGNNTSSTYAGVISGTGGLTKVGTGTFTVTGANTYTGATTINGGTLAVTTLADGGTASPLGASSNVPSNLVIDGGTLLLNNSVFTITDRAFTIGANGATITAVGTQPVVINPIIAAPTIAGTGPRTLTLDGTGNATLRAGLNDNGPNVLSVTKAGPGRWNRGNLIGNYTGATTINGGTLSVSTVANGGVVSTLGASSSAAANLVLNGGTLEFVATANLATDRLFTLGTNGGTLRVSSVEGETLSFTGTGTIVAAGSGNRTLTFDGGPGTFVPVIANPSSGTTAVSKTGTGTWVLAGANTYTGPTTINAGTLFVNGNQSASPGTTTISAGTLAGAGTLGGAVIANGGSVVPGQTAATPGRLTVNGNVEFGMSAAFTVELNGTTAGTQYDQLLVTGANRTVTLGGASLNRTLGYTPAASDKLFIVVNQDATSTVNGTFGGLNQGDSFLIGATTAYISYQGDSVSGALLGGNDVVIAFQPVPEPGCVLALAGVIALGWRLRRAGSTRAAC